MKTETVVPKLNTNAFYQEPTRDEIALAAFLAWERDGRQPGRETHYWLQAESQLRLSRLKKAEAAAQAALPWPRPSRTAQVKKAGASVARNLTIAVTRSTAPKTAVMKATTTKSTAPKQRPSRAA